MAAIIVGMLGLGLAGCVPWNESQDEPKTALATPRQAKHSTVATKASPFGKYDRVIMETIKKQWWQILDEEKFKTNRIGKVVVLFHLHLDGAVTDLKTLENTAGDLLGDACLKAITDSAPFAPWPSDMVRMVGKDYREITFTFNYY